MPTLRQERAVKLKVEESRKQDPMTLGNILRTAGYSEATAIKPSQVFDSPGFQRLLAKYDDRPVLDAIYSDCFIKDKRAAFANRKLYLDVKGYTKDLDSSGDIDLLMRLRKQE